MSGSEACANMDWSRYFKYDTDTGLLHWIERSAGDHATPDRYSWPVEVWNRKYAGSIAGCQAPSGYVMIKFMGRSIRAHHVIWEMHYGPIPEGKQIDHRDGVRSNNRPSNLRLATHAQNMRNKKRIGANQLRGVRMVGAKWVAIIHLDGKNTYLGTFDSKEEAHAAYVAAARKRDPEFFRTD